MQTSPGAALPDRALPTAGEPLPVVGLGTWRVLASALLRRIADAFQRL